MTVHKRNRALKTRVFTWAALVLLLFGLGCRIFQSPATTPTRAPASSPTPPPAEGMTLQEAWQLASPQVRAWAADAQLSEEWTCNGALSPDGRCNFWRGVLVSAAQQAAAELEVKDGQAAVIPGVSPAKRYLEAAFSPEGMLDSPEIAQLAWKWLETNGLKGDDTDLRGVALRSSPATEKECGTSPAYYVLLATPQGQLCLDPHDGRITSNTYGK
jgi:hypothetical protein